MKQFIALLLVVLSTAGAFAQSNPKEPAMRPDLDLASTEVSTRVDVLPEFNGNWAGYLYKNLEFPDAALVRMSRDSTASYQRFVYKFVVCEDGGICNLELVKGDAQNYPELAAEALRVIRQSPLWKPGMVNGKPVKAYFTQPITFRAE